MSRLDWSQKRFLTAVLVTFVGNSCTFIVCGKISYDVFGVGSVFGAMLFLEQLKALSFSAIGGSLVDQFGSRRVSVLCDLTLFLSGSFFAWLAYLGFLKAAVIGTLFFVNGVKPFYSTAIFALVRGISQPEEAHLLNSKSAAVQQIGYLAGLAVAGALITIAPPASLLLIDALTYLVSALLLLSCQVSTAAPTPEAKVSRKPFSVFHQLQNLIQLGIKTPDLFRAALGIGTQVTLITAYNSCLFKMVAERYPAHPDYLSVLEAAYTLAVIGGALLVSRIPALTLGSPKIWILFSIQALALGLLALPMPISGAMITVVGFGILSALIFPSCFSALYRAAPEDQIGQVGGYKGVIQALVAFPVLLINSLLMDLTGIQPSYLWMAVICIACTVYYWLSWSAKRRITLEAT
jgi:predicted MFS family arabinose efflux permease